MLLLPNQTLSWGTGEKHHGSVQPLLFEFALCSSVMIYQLLYPAILGMFHCASLKVTRVYPNTPKLSSFYSTHTRQYYYDLLVKGRL